MYYLTISQQYFLLKMGFSFCLWTIQGKLQRAFDAFTNGTPCTTPALNRVRSNWRIRGDICSPRITFSHVNVTFLDKGR